MGNRPSLRQLLNDHKGRFVHKWEHYPEIYENHFERFRGTECVVLEIGVSHGGSMQLWREYFGPRSRIIGIDNNPICKNFEIDGVEIYIGSQSDRDFLQLLKRKLPKIDVLIDDGGHYMDMQIATFEELYPHVAKDGVYLCEDVHTSYIDEYGGGLNKSSSFIEYTKRLIDQLHAFHSRDKEVFAPDKFTRSTNSIHFYDSIIAIEKKMRPKRADWIRVGDKTLENYKRIDFVKNKINNFLKRNK